MDLGLGGLMVQGAAPGRPGEHLVGLGYLLVVLIGERDADVHDGDPGLAGEVDRTGRDVQQLVMIAQAAEDGGLVVHDQQSGVPGVNGQVLGGHRVSFLSGEGGVALLRPWGPWAAGGRGGS
jgi:hypothetical protein